MPRFYFHLHNDIDVPDEQGADFTDVPAARVHALEEARALFGQVAKDDGCVVLSHRIDIENEQREVVETIYLRDAVRVEP